ncbi:MAG: TIGR00266 family protein [Clostridiales bacterium]|nr:TIGR00266 family protein [Clostridiales bacterium]MCF8023514.1 TIGR00266 family protein [Clostridiales bacterium]
MVDVIDYQIYGDDMQVVEIELDPDEGVRAEVGAMMFMEDGINMQTSSGGGLFKGFKRMFTGEGFFITTFANKAQEKSRVTFGAPYPGKIVPVDLQNTGESFICQKDAFLCAANGVDLDIAFSKKLGAGFFGGEGFILQKLSGEGMAFIHAGGTVIKKQLGEGEHLKVDTGCLAGFEPTVDYNIEFVGGFKNALFGGEGLFLATLTGPGTVYLQSLPFSRLADRLISASGSAQKGESKGFAGVGGGILGGSVLGGILSGDDDDDD